jgi:plastocyanin
LNFYARRQGAIRAALLIPIIMLGVSAARAQSVVTGVVVLADHARDSGKKPDHSNAVIWLTTLPAPTAADRAALSELARQRFRLVQQHKRFSPHVLVIPAGAAVEFPNFDPFFHNVFSLFDGKRFDLGLYEAGTTHAVRFERAGISYIFCNIHPEMSAVVVALNTPYYAISNRFGEVSIAHVPAGRYAVNVWHERASQESLKEFAREINVTATGASLGTIRLAASQDLLNPHKNKYGQDYTTPNPPGALYGQP